MGILANAKWNWDKVSVLKSLLEKWRPRNCETEKDYENSLIKFLEKELDRTITKQPARGRYRADLVVDKKLFIEIKYNLKSTSEFQRLKGQLDEYKKWDGQLILLLIGETPRDLKEELRSYLKEQGLIDTFSASDPFGLTKRDKVIVIEK